MRNLYLVECLCAPEPNERRRLTLRWGVLAVDTRDALRKAEMWRTSREGDRWSTTLCVGDVLDLPPRIGAQRGPRRRTK